jgi:hypothetical protein
MPPAAGLQGPAFQSCLHRLRHRPALAVFGMSQMPVHPLNQGGALGHGMLLMPSLVDDGHGVPPRRCMNPGTTPF